MPHKDYSQLPSAGRLLEKPELRTFPHAISALAVKQAIAEARKKIAEGSPQTEEQILLQAVRIAQSLSEPFFKPVINASGTILHTGLGRARLAKSVAEAVFQSASSHISLEIDLETGTRGDRQKALRQLLTRLTGAEDALVVNNNAAAVFLTLNTLSAGKSVLLSRGQSVEIGGSFRMPEVIRSAGTRLIDVGCTNKTRMSDYESACTEDTVAIVRCHPSNFRIVGFVQEPSPKELAECAHKLGLLLIDDVGSGCLLDTRKFGLPYEPTINDSLSAGADIVTASGDKLLGGPQAGIILGKRELIGRIAKNPLARAVRIDKLTATALEATLRLYEEGRELEIPTWHYIAKPLSKVKSQAKRVLRQLSQRGLPVVMEAGTCEVGGGSLPGVVIPSWRIGLKRKPLETLAHALRNGTQPIIPYIENDTLWLDLRTVDDKEIPTLVQAVLAAWESLEKGTPNLHSSKKPTLSSSPQEQAGGFIFSEEEL